MLTTSLDHRAAELAKHEQFQGVLATGYPVPWSPTSWEPGPTLLIVSMSPDMLVGVMTSNSSVLLVVVDKRLQQGLGFPPARSVTVTLNAQALPGDDAIDILSAGSDGHGAPRASYAGAGVLEIQGLTGGDAAAVVIRAAEALPFAFALRQWRFTAARPAMSSVWTASYDTYNELYASRLSSSYIVGQLAPSSSSLSASMLTQGQHHNLLTANESSLAAVLNEGLRQGAGVLALVRDVAQVAAVRRSVGCHPNFAGFVLAGGEDVDATDASVMSQLKASRNAVIQEASHAFAVANARSAQAVLQISSTAGLPMVALALPSAECESQGASECVEAAVRELVELRDALPAGLDLPAQKQRETAFLAAIDPCAGTAGQARLLNNAALMLGASGLLHRGTGATCGREQMVAGINGNVAQLTSSGKLTPSQSRLITVRQPDGAKPWPLPRSVSRRAASGAADDGLVLNMSGAVLLGVFAPVGADGKVNATKEPPTLFLLDTRTDAAEHEQNVSVTLMSDVLGWTPYVGGCELPACRKLVLGNVIKASLWPGEAMMLALTAMRKP